MSCLLPKSQDKKDEVLRLAKNGMAIAELEYLGLSTKIVSLIEENCGAIYLEQLLKMKDDQILGMRSLGGSSIKQIKKVLEKIFEFSSKVESWNQGSEKIENYKKKINKKKLLA